MALSTERQSARMSEIKNSGLYQYGAEPFEQQQFGPAGTRGAKTVLREERKMNTVAMHISRMLFL